MNDPFTITVAVVLILAPIPHFIAFVILRNASIRGDRISALDERLHAAFWWLLSATIIGLLTINAVLGRPVHIDAPWPQLMIGLALVLGALPAALFLVRYWRGGFRD